MVETKHTTRELECEFDFNNSLTEQADVKRFIIIGDYWLGKS